MNTKPKATIVITNYNQGHLIEKAFESALTQSYDSLLYDIVIVDDGSTDNSLEKIHEIVENYQVSRDGATVEIPIKIIAKKNGRTASARNAGWKATENPIVAFLDADDSYGHFKLEKSIEALTRYENVGLVYSDYAESMPDKKTKRSFKPPFDANALRHSCIVSTNSVYLRSALEKIGGFDESLTYAEDYDSYLRLVNAGYMIRHIPQVLFGYNNHGQNKTATSDMTKWQTEERAFKERAANGIFRVDN